VEKIPKEGEAKRLFRGGEPGDIRSKTNYLTVGIVHWGKVKNQEERGLEMGLIGTVSQKVGGRARSFSKVMI